MCDPGDRASRRHHPARTSDDVPAAPTPAVGTGGTPTAPTAAVGTPPTPDSEPATQGDATQVATLRARFQAAEADRRAHHTSTARTKYEDVVRMAWTAQVPNGGPGARIAAQARMALGDILAAGIRPLPHAKTPDAFSASWRQVTNRYSEAAQQYGKVALYGHTDLTQCALVRSARAAEQLAHVTDRIEAPESIAQLGGSQAQSFVSGFHDAATSYVRVARGLYEAASRIPAASGCRSEAMDGMTRTMHQLGDTMP